MNLKIIEAPTIEPVSLIEVKNHLRLDTASFSTGVISTQSIKPGSHNIASNYSLIGNYIDVLGYESMAVLEVGTIGIDGSVNVKIQESNDHIIFTDAISGAFAQVTPTDNGKTYQLAYTGKMRYIRAVATVTVASSFSVSIVKDALVNIEDTLLLNLITVARQMGETITKRALASATFELTLDKFPANEVIILPMPPIELPITSIKYRDKDGKEAILQSQDYIAYDDMPAKIIPAYGKSFPDIELYPIGAIKIRYVAGHKTTGDDASLIIPKEIKQGLLLLIADYYEYRGNLLQRGHIPKTVPFGVRALLESYKIWSL